MGFGVLLIGYLLGALMSLNVFGAFFRLAGFSLAAYGAKKLSDFAGSTTAIMGYVKKSDRDEFVIGTENSIVQHLQFEVPDKKFDPLTKECVCKDMRLTTLVDVYNCLRGVGGEEIILDEYTLKNARRAIDNMLK